MFLGDFEEFAVASLLWDFYDKGSDPVDWDDMDLTIDELWDVIANTTTNDLSDMLDVYEAFLGAGYDQSKVDKIFIAHGFFEDKNGNHIREPNERVGYGGMEGRRNFPLIRQANILVNMQYPNGTPVDAGMLTINISFNPPYDVYNYSYEIDYNELSNCLLPLIPPPGRYSAMVEIQAKNGIGPPFRMSNVEFWDKVAASELDYIAEHTFVVPYISYLPLIKKNYTK